MTHQRHFVEGRLSVENDIVIVFQVSLDLVARLNVLIGAVPQIMKINIVVVRPYNVPRTRPIVRPILHKLPHLIYVLTGDGLGDGESESDLYWHSELVESEDGIRGDNRTR